MSAAAGKLSAAGVASDADADWEVVAKTEDTAKWIQCEDKSSAEYKAFFVEGWTSWQPYLSLGSKNKHKNVASIHTQKWLKSSGWSVIPKTFGEYAIGVMPPDSALSVDAITPQTATALEEEVLIVNHGIVAGAATQSNTLNKRLMTYGTKVKPYEWALGVWMNMGFRVFVKWREMQADDEAKGLSSIAGAVMRKTAETNALKKWKFFLNVGEQRDVKGSGASLTQDPHQLIVREEKSHIVTARDYLPKTVDIKLKCLQLLLAVDKTDAVRVKETVAFLKSLN